MPTSLVIGASGDLGAAVSKTLFAAGHTVLVHGFEHFDRLEEVRIAVNASEALLADVTDEESVARMFEKVPALDNLIFSAGINPTASKAVDTDVEVWRRIIDVNLTGAFICLRAGVEALRGSSASPSVVLVSSIFGLNTPARRAAYGASKHGLTALVQALTKEEGSWLRVNAVCPGPMWSENLRRILAKHAAAEDITLEEYVLKRVADVPAGRLMELEECASVVAFLCDQGGSFVRGECIRVSGGAVQ